MNLKKNIVVHSVGLAMIVLIIIGWTVTYYPYFPDSILYSLYSVIFCFSISLYTLPPPKPRILRTKRHQVLPTVLSCYCIILVIIATLRIDYSRPILLTGIVLTVIWFSAFRFYYTKHMKVFLYTLSNIDKECFQGYQNLVLEPINSKTEIKNVQGVLVNLHQPLSSLDERFLADCSLSGIPIYHSHLLLERLDKQVSTTHLTRDTIEVLSPRKRYLKLKHIADKVIAACLLTLSLPIMLVVSLTIKLNNPNEKILFIQERIGYNAKAFLMYKFRTMTSINAFEPSFATNESVRIDRLGKWLRQTRLDELPQLLNVIKGEMSLIGPRPEQPKFVDIYQQEIPFYGYRHTVKPGISGWAQVEQGYTDSLQSTKDKLSYDLYYIKHLSLELDIQIAIQTIKTILLRKGT